MGYYYSQGKWKNIFHKSSNNVTFHYHYLQFCFANLEGNNNISCHPEVFLNKSYYYLHHIFCNTWVPHQDVVLTSEYGSLVVIFKAIIVFWNRSSSKLYGKLVSKSVHIWDLTIKSLKNQEQKRNNTEGWDNISEIIKDANIVFNQVDYHENFNAEIFENLFLILYKTFYEKYRPVNIHIDEVRYYK